MIISFDFEVQDDLRFCRYRRKAGHLDSTGRWVSTSDERTGPFGKWHILAGLDQLSTACGAYLPVSLGEGLHTTTAAPPGLDICRPCLDTLPFRRGPTGRSFSLPSY